jgi:hypothetical protein
MRITALICCEDCGDVEITLQVPDGTSRLHIAEHLDEVTFESMVRHELTAHLVGLATA